jgi:ribosomal protein L37AE/L43A
MHGRLRNCCSLCGSLSISRVKSLHIYRCYSCNQSFVTPSTRFVESYIGHSLMLSAKAGKIET